MKVSLVVLATFVALAVAQPPNKPPQQLSEAQKRQQASLYCTACHENLKSCLNYGFASADNKAATQKWANCLKSDILQWRTETGGLKYWPDAESLSRGEVLRGRVDPLKPTRVACINYMVEADAAGCKYCVAFTADASKKFENKSRKCGGQ